MAKTTKKKKINKTNKNAHTKKEVLNNIENDHSISKVIKCIVSVLAIFGIMYLLTVLILKKSSTDYITKDVEKTTIQYSEILAGTSFDKKDNEYLVIYYDLKEDDNSIYQTLLSDYEAKDNHLPIYYVDLSNSMNKSVISTESNKEANSVAELQINGPTLIKFSNHKIIEYIEGKEDISNYLNN